MKKERRRLAEVSRDHGECCRIAKLEDGRCRVSLPVGREINAIGGTLYQRNHGHEGRLADGIVFWSPADNADECAAAVELKGGRVDVTVAAGQLQNGAALIDDLSHGVPGVMFTPILAIRQLDVMDLMMVERATVRFRGREHKIVRVRCGADLGTVMRPHKDKKR
jgi:hypothetical protein